MRPKAVAGGREVIAGLFGGKGQVEVNDLLGANAAAPFQAVLACELSPGGSVGRHAQEHFAEIVVVLDGEGVARVSGAPVELRSGVVVHLPLGQSLELENRSPSAPLHYLIIKAG